MKTWIIKNLKTLILAGLLILAMVLVFLKWYSALIIFVAMITIVFVIIAVFRLLESASDETPLPIVDLRVLQKHPNVANVEKLRLRYLQETGRTRPSHLDRSVPDGLNYLSWVETLATQMLVLLDHVENEKR